MVDFVRGVQKATLTVGVTDHYNVIAAGITLVRKAAWLAEMRHISPSVPVLSLVNHDYYGMHFLEFNFYPPPSSPFKLFVFVTF